MSIEEKIRDAKKVNWLTVDHTEEELKRLREEAYAKAKEEYNCNFSDNYVFLETLPIADCDCCTLGEEDCRCEYCQEDMRMAYNQALKDILFLIEETRAYKFGICDADFVLDVISAKIKERYGLRKIAE